jgi:hypothetical protein
MKNVLLVAFFCLFLVSAGIAQAFPGGSSANVGVNQGQSTTVGAGSGANQQAVTFNSGDPVDPRYPVVPYQPGYPQLPYLLLPAQEGDNLVGVLDFLVSQQEFSLGQLVNIYQSFEDNGDILINGKKFDLNGMMRVPSSNKILVIYKHNPLIRNAVPLTGKGVGNRKKEACRVDSHKVLAALGIYAIAHGNNVLKVGTQGGNTVQINKAFGIGLGGSGGGITSGGLTLSAPVSASLVRGQANIAGQPFISSSACTVPDYQLSRLAKENWTAIQRDAMKANLISGPEPEVKKVAPETKALVPTMKP